MPAEFMNCFGSLFPSVCLVPPLASTPPTPGTWAFLLPALMFVVLVACVASLYPEGLWGNAIRLVNVVFAALLAVNFWEPLARYAEGIAPTFTYFWDFLCLWGLFGLFMILFRVPTQLLSRVKVRFLKIADRIGCAMLTLWIGWVMVGFTMFTLHTAPLSEYFLFGAFRAGEANLPLGLAPDLQWAGFVQKMSRGPFSRGLGEAETAPYGRADDQREAQTAVFDRNGDFVPKYAARRRALQTYIEEKGTARAAESDVIKR